MGDDIETTIKQFVDYLLPELTPYETSIYLYLLRKSFMENGASVLRVGKRSIAVGLGKGAGEQKTSYKQVSKILQKLEKKGCIKILDTNIHGTQYKVILPKEVPLVVEKIVSLTTKDSAKDYFTDPEKRREIFERDNWICQYCGEKLTEDNCTLDHFIPQSKGGKSSKDNLKTCCLICNSIKSGKTYEDATSFLLKSIQERRARSSK